MAWDDVIAGIVGAFGGGLDVWGAQQRQRKADDERARQEARQEAADERLRKLDAEAAADRERGRLRDMRTDMGSGATVSPELAARFRDADLGHVLEDEPEFESSIFAGQGMPGLSGMPTMSGLPEMSTRTTIAPTAAERARQAENDAKKAAAATQAKQIADWINALPPHLQGAARGGQITGKVPTFSPDDYVTPEERERREIDASVKKARAMLPVKADEAHQDARIRRSYAASPAPLRDNPALPMGVRKYIADTIANYQADPNGAAAARAEMQRAMPKLLEAHPRLDVTQVMRQLEAGLPLPKLTDVEMDAQAAVRKDAADKAAAAAAAGTPPTTQNMTPDLVRPPAAQPMTPGKLPVPVPLAGGRRPGQPAQQVVPSTNGAKAISRAKLQAMAARYRIPVSQMEAQAGAEGYAIVP